MKDRPYAEGINAHVAAQLQKYLPLAEEVFANINGRLE
jgi:hypothetical protein